MGSREYFWMAYHAFRVTEVTRIMWGILSFSEGGFEESVMLFYVVQASHFGGLDGNLLLDGMLMRLACGSLNVANLPFVLPPPVFTSSVFISMGILLIPSVI